MKVIVENGKRKTAEARATVRDGKGEIRLNSMRLDAVQNPLVRARINEALKLAGDLANKVDVEIETNGGGYRRYNPSTFRARRCRKQERP